MATYRTKCNQCDFEREIVEMPRYYVLADGNQIHVETQFAWCSSCQSVIQAERIRSLSEIDDQLAKFVSRDLQTMEDLRVWESPCSDAEFEARLERYVSALKLRREARRNRIAPAKCLECGCTSIVPFQETPWPDHMPDPPEEDFQTIEHPGCGGRLKLTCDALSIPMHRYSYSPEGVLRKID